MDIENKEVTVHERVRRTPADIAGKCETVTGKNGGIIRSKTVQYQPL